MLKILLTNECDEFLTYYPQYTDMYRNLELRFTTLINEMETIYDEIKDITNHVDYAQKVKSHQLNGTFFQLKAGNIKTVDEGIRKMCERSSGVKKLLKILNKI